MRNPWMSIYLSTANRIAGAARSQVIAEVGRQRTTARKKAAKQVAGFWTGGFLTAPPAKKRRKARR